MSQLSLRLVSPPREAPRSCAVEPARVETPPPGPGAGRSATIAHLRSLLGSRGRVGILPNVPGADTFGGIVPGNVSTGIDGLDTWLRGWPRPGLVELAGSVGCGRLALVTPLLAQLTRQGRTVLLVDPLQQVHPPGLCGVDLAHLVLVRCPGERAGWVAEQVARSGAVDVLVVIDAPVFGRGGVRIARAAEAGGMGVFVLSERPDVGLPASLRLEVGGWRGVQVQVRCTRSRDGRRVGERWIAPGEAPTGQACSEQPTRLARLRMEAG